MIHVERMIRASVEIAVAVALLTLSTAAPAQAQAAAIEATAPLVDKSEASINAALDSAFESAVRGAAAMGLTKVEILSVYVGDDFVGVHVIASAQPPDSADTEGTTGRAPGMSRTGRAPYDL
jgi:hypothetical protein